MLEVFNSTFSTFLNPSICNMSMHGVIWHQQVLLQRWALIVAVCCVTSTLRKMNKKQVPEAKTWQTTMLKKTLMGLHYCILYLWFHSMNVIATHCHIELAVLKAVYRPPDQLLHFDKCQVNVAVSKVLKKTLEVPPVSVIILFLSGCCCN